MTQTTSDGLGAPYSNAASSSVRPLKVFERRLPTEEEDYHEIVQGMLHAQARLAAAQARPLGRGTHTKGVCVRGTFEILDLAQTIPDPVMRARLMQGIFAKPGKYPAVIRYANAESTIQPDFTPDVRAVSFSITVPAGVLGDSETRLDYSLNNATTFPINDSHQFAVLMRVLEAGGSWAKLKALTTLSPIEFESLIEMGIAAKQQKRNSVRPYQTMRYWSGVPFRHGPDEAIKYSLTPSPDNPASNPRQSPDMLRDELLRHVDNDTRMAEFDFGVQLLDSAQMRYRNKQRDDFFWVENASFEWPEDQAPFHKVGRLTLAKGSHLSEEQTNAFYIDVNEHSTVDSHPLGSINRARWFGESASRRARLGLPNPASVDPLATPDPRTGAPLPAAPVERGMWIGNVTLRSVGKAGLWLAAAVAVALLAFTIGVMTVTDREIGMLPATHVENTAYPKQGFGAGLEDDLRQTYYYTPQGAGLEDLRYTWFRSLEMPWGTTKLSDPEVMRRYGFLVDEPTPKNPDGMPVGFTKHYDQNLHEELLDITCATCHTGQLEFTQNGHTRAVRIDGGSADHAFTSARIGQFLPTLIASLFATEINPLKFNRFARSVLGSTYPEGKWTLRRNIWGVLAKLGGIGLNERIHGLSPTEEGYGRTDALARIANTVFGQNLDKKNYHVGNAPVSYPAVWNIWKFDWVQYTASVSQPMARNLGEAMGVGATYKLVDDYGAPLPPDQQFRTTAQLADLSLIENTIWKLKPPTWDADLFGPINQARADSGRALFNENCVGCHGPHIAPAGIKAMNSPLKRDSEPEWLVTTLCADDIGTDPTSADNFSNAFVDISRTGLTAIDLRRVARVNLDQFVARKSKYLNGEIARLRNSKDSSAYRDSAVAQLAGLPDWEKQQLSEIDPKHLRVGAALSYLGVMIREKQYADMHYDSTTARIIDGFGRLDVPEIVDGYKSRPLAGVWATPPFLHNGSVPTVYDLLSPPSERPKTFMVGSREYDPRKLGLSQDTSLVKGYATFNTDKKYVGNSNLGHEFGPGYDSTKHEQARKGLIGRSLSPAERYAIIEYLKIRDDDVDGPKAPRIPHTCAPVR